ncbi:hypothetical protein K3495_g9844 [Podosphaera aphanis]|nr:hypothetical protein K3495_g9844 [Podosphaera aphanis]
MFLYDNQKYIECGKEEKVMRLTAFKASIAKVRNLKERGKDVRGWGLMAIEFRAAWIFVEFFSTANTRETSRQESVESPVQVVNTTFSPNDRIRMNVNELRRSLRVFQRQISAGAYSVGISISPKIVFQSQTILLAPNGFPWESGHRASDAIKGIGTRLYDLLVRKRNITSPLLSSSVHRSGLADLFLRSGNLSIGLVSYILSSFLHFTGLSAPRQRSLSGIDNTFCRLGILSLLHDERNPVGYVEAFYGLYSSD